MFNCSKNLLSFLSKSLKKSVICVGFAASLLSAHQAQATIVQFQTVMGDFQVNLYDKTTPETVKNFLAYVKADAYKNSVIHRSVPGFIIQGGGFQYPNKSPLLPIEQKPAAMNEPIYANKRGTIAMAKLADDANSATNQWFFNLADNRSNLDSQNKGFTVFGEVEGNGMAIIDAMAKLTIFNMGGVFSAFPLRNYSATDATNGVAIGDKNLVLILNVLVLDANVETAAGLTPEKNANTPTSSVSSSTSSTSSTSTSSTATTANPTSGSSGGGSIDMLGLLILLTISIANVRKGVRRSKK